MHRDGHQAALVVGAGVADRLAAWAQPQSISAVAALTGAVLSTTQGNRTSMRALSASSRARRSVSSAGSVRMRIVVLSQHAFRRPCPTPPKATAKTAESASSGP